MALPPKQLTDNFRFKFYSQDGVTGGLQVYLPNELHFDVETIRISDTFRFRDNDVYHLKLITIENNPQYTGSVENEYAEYVGVFELTHNEQTEKVSLQ